MDAFHISKDKTALLIVDIQERLVPAMPEGPRVIANCLHLIELAKMYNMPVLVTEQYPKGLGHTVAEIKDALPDYDPAEKTSFSCCGDDNFFTRLRETGRRNILITGMEAHVCVLQTCLDLLAADYNVHLIKDAVCSRSADNLEIGTELMRDAGAVITCTETVLFQLLKKAGTEEFKVISKRIK
jgi:nicotinamidase-related amidase